MLKNTQNKKGLTIGLPCFNEEKIIYKVIADCVKILTKNFDNWELIIVDNKSSDFTTSIAEKKILTFKKNIQKNIKLIKNKKNI